MDNLKKPVLRHSPAMCFLTSQNKSYMKRMTKILVLYSPFATFQLGGRIHLSHAIVTSKNVISPNY